MVSFDPRRGCEPAAYGAVLVSVAVGPNLGNGYWARAGGAAPGQVGPRVDSGWVDDLRPVGLRRTIAPLGTRPEGASWLPTPLPPPQLSQAAPEYLLGESTTGGWPHETSAFAPNTRSSAGCCLPWVPNPRAPQRHRYRREALPRAPAPQAHIPVAETRDRGPLCRPSELHQAGGRGAVAGRRGPGGRRRSGPTVRAMLCFVEADWPMIVGAFSTRGVAVVWPKRAESLLRVGGPNDEAAVDVLHHRLTEVFPPARGRSHGRVATVGRRTRRQKRGTPHPQVRRSVSAARFE